MELDKSIIIQKQIKDNSDDLQSEFLDLKNWEKRMEKVDSEIRNAGGDQIIPPVRRKKKAQKESSKPSNRDNDAKPKRIKSHDYSAWEKFDANKACEEAGRSDDQEEEEERRLSAEELEKNHTKATERKVAGNNFVKLQKWSKAAACYNEAIKIFPYDAVFYANRALCQLKMDNLHSAEADCTAAIKLDEFYVKAYHRRATARICLKRYDEAAADVKKILKLEPSNREAIVMLAQIDKWMESSKRTIISTTKNREEKLKVLQNIGSKINVVEKSDEKRHAAKSKNDLVDKKSEKMLKEDEKLIESKKPLKLPEWLPEVREDVEIVKVITKAPHQRSKKPLRTVPIKEIEFSNENGKNFTIEETKESVRIVDKKEISSLEKIEGESALISVPEAPRTAVQFLLNWRKNPSMQFRYEYLKKIEVERIPNIFQDSMESTIFSEILKVLRCVFVERKEPVIDWLKSLSEVKRFRTLTMFMSDSDKEDVRVLFDYGVTLEGKNDDITKQLRLRYEI